MCGIGGFFGAELRPQEADEKLRAMGASLRLRGPDDEGFFFDPQADVGFVHRRLAVIDLTPSGHQPMQSQDRRYVITFNGEIYNFESMRSELERAGARFAGTSDTEVLLSAIVHWGIESALERCVGMFAFALWDHCDRVLYLARDRLGEKPLCLARLGRGFAFASDLAALRSAGFADSEVDPQALALYLKFACVPAPHAIHPNTSKLMPGSILAIASADTPVPAELSDWQRAGEHGTYRLFSRKFWDIETFYFEQRPATRSASERDLQDELDGLLQQAVALQRHADVPVGAFLSGGIDSSLVCSVTQSVSSSPVRTFTMGFDDPLFDESEYANSVARHLGTDHTCVRVSAKDIIDWVPRVTELADEPFANPSQLPSFLVSKIAREDVTVCLTGDGGDELFCGYNRYLAPMRVNHLKSLLPAPLDRLAASLLRAVPARGVDRLAKMVSTVFGSRRTRVQSPGKKLHTLAQALAIRDPATLYESLMSTWQDPTRLVPLTGQKLPPFEDCSRPWTWDRFADRAMLWDLKHYLPDDGLTKVDRASMAISLETRLPLLDHRIVEFALGLPAELKVKHGAGKHMLRTALARHLPRDLLDRPKMGFSVPVAAWLRGPLRDWAEHLLSRQATIRAGLFEPEPVQRCWDEHVSGRRDNNLKLWAVIQAHAWTEKLRAREADTRPVGS